MEQIENGLPSSQTGFEQTLQLLEAFREMTAVMMELIRKPAVNYNNYGTIQNFVCGDYHAHAATNNSTAPERYSNRLGIRESRVPTFDEMMTVFKKANEDGLWSSMRSWGVGFQMWLIWGWEGSVTEYVNLVINSGKMGEFDYQCNLDAVYKMISQGHMSLHLENWYEDGVKDIYCKLGEKINRELLKLYPPKDIED